MSTPNPEWPAETPHGTPFPYSHFGDIERRTQLLKDIGSTFLPEPRNVINMGCGYDITPSMAYPDAHVVHIDLHTPDYIDPKYDVIDFLIRAGFDARTLDQIHDDQVFDIGISVLGPNIFPELITPGGIIVTTQAEFEPETTNLEGIVLADAKEEDGFEILSGTERERLEQIWLEGEDIHLAIYRKES